MKKLVIKKKNALTGHEPLSTGQLMKIKGGGDSNPVDFWE